MWRRIDEAFEVKRRMLKQIEELKEIFRFSREVVEVEEYSDRVVVRIETTDKAALLYCLVLAKEVIAGCGEISITISGNAEARENEESKRVVELVREICKAKREYEDLVKNITNDVGKRLGERVMISLISKSWMMLWGRADKEKLKALSDEISGELGRRYDVMVMIGNGE